MTVLLALLAAYFLGAIPTSYWVARYVGGIDLREFGSRNLGATNLYRALGWRYAVPVGAFDVAKGAIPVLVFAPWAGSAPWLPVAAGTAAVVGHVFSLFVGFKGGKGVATAAGVVLALAPLAVLVTAAVWAVVVKGSGYVSLGSVVAAVAFPVTVWLVGPRDPYLIGAGGILATFIVFTHRANIRRLLKGTEARFGQRREA